MPPSAQDPSQDLAHRLPQHLPVSQHATEIVAAAKSLPAGGFLVLRAEPGSGKTTLVPALLAEHLANEKRDSDSGPGMILVTEPRRLAAIGAAQHAAHLMGESVGESIGYAVRGDKKWGPKTQVLYVTEGVALNLLSDPDFISRLKALVIDEFHERHASTDDIIVIARWWSQGVAHGILKHPLRMVLMSATFDSDKYNPLFQPMRRIDVSGKVFPLTVHYEPLDDVIRQSSRAGSGLATSSGGAAQFAPWREPAFWREVASVTLREARLLYRTSPGTHVLCFLPGKGEISRVRTAIQALLGDAPGFSVEELHGERPIDQLLEALNRGKRRDEESRAASEATTLMFLATNIAESSVTLPGVRVVIDTGLMRIAKHHLASGTQELSMAKIGQNSAGQRAGRAAREAPGKVIRLYSEADHFKRPSEMPPEICVSDLSRDLLDLMRATSALSQTLRSPAAENSDVCQLPSTPESWLDMPWIDPPPAERIQAAVRILRGTGCFDDHGGITDQGRTIGALPLPVRLGAVLLCAKSRQDPRVPLGAVAAICALITEGDVTLSEDHAQGDDQNEILTQYQSLRRFLLGEAPAHAFHRRLARVVHSVRNCLAVLGLNPKDSGLLPRHLPARFDLEALGHIFFAGYFDAVAKSTVAGSLEHMNGETYVTACAQTPGFFLVLDGVRIHGTGSKSAAHKLATKVLPIDSVTLLDAPADVVKETEVVEFTGSFLRVRSRMCYATLVIEEDLLPVDHPQFVRAVAEWLAQGPVLRVLESAPAESLLKRLASLAGPEFTEVREELCASKATRSGAPGGSGTSADSADSSPKDTDRLAWSIPAVARRLAQHLSTHCVQSRTSVTLVHDDLVAPHAFEDWMLGPEGARALRRASPTELRLANGTLVRVSYEGQSPTLTGKIQDFYGIQEHPRLSSLGSDRRSAAAGPPLSVVLLAPGGQTAQITSDLPSFWKTSYPEIRRVYAGRYPRHHWPDDPATARPLVTKRQVAAQTASSPNPQTSGTSSTSQGGAKGASKGTSAPRSKK